MMGDEEQAEQYYRKAIDAGHNSALRDATKWCRRTDTYPMPTAFG
jgi:TPR repeat protein